MSDKMPDNCACQEIKKYYDYVIVGNGTAGAIVARKLTDNYKNKVLVLEIGRNRTNDPIVKNPMPTTPFPVDVGTDLTFNPAYAQSYAVPSYPSDIPVDQRYPPFLQAVTYTEGRLWGGGSAHNYLAWVRGTPPIYDQWASLSGNSRWTFNNLLPIMKANETFIPNAVTPVSSQRGTTGPLFDTEAATIIGEPVANALIAGTNTAYKADFNSYASPADFTSISSQQMFVTPSNERSYSIPSYLPVGEIIDENGNGLNGRPLKIKSAALVSKIIFSGTRAIGVEYIKNHGSSNSVVEIIYAKKKVILCSGAINTPAILQRSGIGNIDTLTKLNIPVVVNNPNVGANLQNHYGPNGIIANVPQLYPSAAIGFVNGNVSTGPDPYFPNDNKRRIEIIPQLLGASPLDPALGLFQFIGFNIDPKSRGSVTIVDTNPVIQPKLDLNMYSDKEGPLGTSLDGRTSVAFYRLLQQISTAIPGSVVLYPPPSSYIIGDEQLLRDAKSVSTSSVSNHISATTRMGTSIANSVVDGNLHVFGTTNLMIADLGAAPVINDGNTAWPAYVIGLVASEILLNEKQCCCSCGW